MKESKVSVECTECSNFNTTPIIVNKKLAYHYCHKCGHCNQFVESKIKAFENAQKHYFSTNLDTLNGVVSEQENKIIKKRFALVKNLLNNPGKIIEVGPGLGIFAKFLLDKGNDLTLIEESSSLSNILRCQNRFTVFEGVFENIDIKSNSFDLFVSMHVIEHVIDAKKHLSKALEIVKPGSYALIATPNGRCWQQRLFPSLSLHYDAAHLRVYSPLSLEYACKSAGWTVINTHTIEPSMGWLRLFTRIFRILKNEDEELTAGKYSNKKSLILSFFIFVFELFSLPFRLLQEKLGGGYEILIICQKPMT